MTIKPESPVIEISTPAFTAMAKNINNLPYRTLMANLPALDGNSSDIVSSMEAAEELMRAALEPKDFTKFTKLTVSEALTVLKDWIDPLSGI